MRLGGKAEGRGPSRDVRRKAWPHLLVGSWAGRALGALWVWGQVKFTACPGAPGWGWHRHVALPGSALGSLPGPRWALRTTAREYYPLAQGGSRDGGAGIVPLSGTIKVGPLAAGPPGHGQDGVRVAPGDGALGLGAHRCSMVSSFTPFPRLKQATKGKETGLVSFHLGAPGSRRAGHLPGPALGGGRACRARATALPCGSLLQPRPRPRAAWRHETLPGGGPWGAVQNGVCNLPPLPLPPRSSARPSSPRSPQRRTPGILMRSSRPR